MDASGRNRFPTFSCYVLPEIIGGDPAIIEPPASARTDSKGNERIFSMITPKELLSYFVSGRTTQEEQTLVAPYIDKWLALKGRVDDVSPYDTFISVSLTHTSGHPGISMYFNPSWKQRLAIVKNDEISAYCRITKIGQYSMALV